MTDLDLLQLEGRTLFVLTAQGLILRENDPDRSPGPKFWLAGSAEGNAVLLHQSVAPDIAAAIETLAAAEPPFHAPATLPRFIARYEELLATQGAPVERSRELVCALPHRLD